MIHTKVCKVDRWETLKKNTQVSQELRKPSLWTQVKSCLINQIRRRRTWTSEVHVTLERHCRDPIDLLVYRKILKSKNIKLLVWGILWSWVFDTKSESLNWSWNTEGLKRRTVEIRVDNLWKFGELDSRREVLLYRELEIFKKIQHKIVSHTKLSQKNVIKLLKLITKLSNCGEYVPILGQYVMIHQWQIEHKIFCLPRPFTCVSIWLFTMNR